MRQTIATIVKDAIIAAAQAGRLGSIDAAAAAAIDPAIERPREETHGDWATTVSMRLTKQAGIPPRAIASAIVESIGETDVIDSIEVAGPGFINFRLSQAALHRVICTARELGADYGRSDVGGSEYIQVEFVSANPTGPMHIGHGRWAALGNAMGNVLEHAGWRVEREFYINDAGSQMDMFGRSVSARYLALCGRSGAETEIPEGGYGGSYVADIARSILDADGEKWLGVQPEEREEAFRELAYRLMLAKLQDILHGIGVDFDVWFSERTLHEVAEDGSTDITHALDQLREAGYLFERDGALWFRSTDFGDDKDRVLVKADGDYTYFAADIAYHSNKFRRGFDKVVNIWGADHHGYVPRMQAACAALGYPGQLEVVLGQLVNLFRDGEAVRMSKRTGEMVTLEELVEEVGADATKYLMLSRSTDQPIDFDIEVAKKQDSSNPVYYVQYAHARICSLLRKAADAGIVLPEAVGAGAASAVLDAAGTAAEVATTIDLSPLTEESELALARKLSEFPETVEWAARNLAPFRLTHYAEDLAAHFHQFYTRCHVLSDDVATSRARLYLADATRTVLAVTLGLLGVTAPERM